MSILATITDPRKPKSKYYSFAAIFLAAILVIVSLLQLFMLEDFLDKLIGYNLPGGDSFAVLIGCLVIVVQIFSLPFLLVMRLSVAMRFCSMISSWLMVFMYVFLWYWSSVNNRSVSTFNEYITSLVLLLPFIIVGVLVVVSSWGLWPSHIRSSSKK